MFRTMAGLMGLLCLALGLQAGVVVEMQEGDASGAGGQQRLTWYIEQGRLRFEGNKQLMIFDEVKQVMWVIDADRKSYYEMTPADLEKVGQQLTQATQQMQEAMKQMEAQMAQMPPEQRQMMEQMMKGKMPGLQAQEAPQQTVREIRGGEKVGPYTCTVYEVLANGQRSQEICAAAFDQIDLREPEYRTFKAIGRFFESLTRALPTSQFAMPTNLQVDGFPVRWREYDGGKVRSEWTLLQVERRDVDASLFALPAGLKKTPLMGQP